VRKWRDRHATEGEAGLTDRSSRPHRSPRRLPEPAEAAIVTLRHDRLSGPAIARRLGRPLSTVGVVLRRHRLGRLKCQELRSKHQPMGTSSGGVAGGRLGLVRWFRRLKTADLVFQTVPVCPCRIFAVWHRPTSAFLGVPCGIPRCRRERADTADQMGIVKCVRRRAGDGALPV
jgi:hypothetical protein